MATEIRESIEVGAFNRVSLLFTVDGDAGPRRLSCGSHVLTDCKERCADGCMGVWTRFLVLCVLFVIIVAECGLDIPSFAFRNRRIPI